MSTDYYTILQVERSASEKEIKTAFRTLAHEHHPDKGGDEKKFKEVNEAYQTLSNKEKRASYDRFGNSSFNGFGAGQQTNGFNMNYADFARGGMGSQFTGRAFKKMPGWVWIFLLPIIIAVAIVGLFVVFLWVIFSTIRVMTNRTFG